MFVPKKSLSVARSSSPFRGLEDRDLFDLLSFYPRTRDFNTMLGTVKIPAYTGYSADDVYRYISSSSCGSPPDKSALSLVVNSMVSCVERKSTNSAFISFFHSLFNPTGLMGVESIVLKMALGELSGAIYPRLVYEELVRASGGMYYERMFEIDGVQFNLCLACDPLCPLHIKKKAIERLSLTLRTRDVSLMTYPYNYAPNSMRNTHIATCVALSDCLIMYRDTERCNRMFVSLVERIVAEGAFNDVGDLVHVLLSYILDHSTVGDNSMFTEYIEQIRRTIMYIEFFFQVDLRIIAATYSRQEEEMMKKCMTMLFTEDV